MSEEKLLEIVSNLADALEAATVNTKHQIAESTGVQGGRPLVTIHRT
jgi:hypothetical protein